MVQTYYRYQAGDRPVAGYVLTRKLGEGGFGEVWLATAPGGTEVALKFINLQGQQGAREFKSLRLVKRIRDIHLVPLHAFWLKNEDGTVIDESDVSWSQSITPIGAAAAEQGPAATMAYSSQPVELIVAMGLGKMSLYDRLKECRSAGLAGIPVKELLKYMEDAALGIDYLNQPLHDLGSGLAGIIHSDIKPQNILILGRGAAVCDFGLAHAVEALRKTCAAPVTVAYAAPESFHGKACDRSDQYSLAITYYELRTGSLPFDEQMTVFEVMKAHESGALDFSKLTPGEQAVIRRATSIQPADRYDCCELMVEDLKLALAQEQYQELTADSSIIAGNPFSVTARPDSRTPVITPRSSVRPVIVREPPRPLRSRSRTLKLAVMLMLLAGVLATGGYLGRHLIIPADSGKDVVELEKEKDEVGGNGSGGERDKDKNEKDATNSGSHETNGGKNGIEVPPDPKLKWESLLAKGDFQGAHAALGKLAAADRPSREERLKQAWRKYVVDLFQQSRFDQVLADYAAMPPAYRDAISWLTEARALICSPVDDKYRKAADAIKKIPVASQLDEPSQRAHALVQRIVAAHTEERDQLNEFHAFAKTFSTFRSGWRPQEEITELDEAQSKVIDRALATAPNEFDELQKILEIADGNAEALLLKVQWYLSRNELDQAQRAFDSIPPNSRDLNFGDARRLYDFVSVQLPLLNPQAQPLKVQKALQDLRALLQRESARRSELAQAAAALVKRDQTGNRADRDSRLDLALAALRPHERDPAVAPSLAAVLCYDVPRHIAKPELSSLRARLFQDCSLIEQFIPYEQIPELVRACHAETALDESGEFDSEKFLTGDGTQPYFHYVRARVLDHAVDRDRRQILESLAKVFVGDEPAPELVVAERAKIAVDLLAKFARDLKRSTGADEPVGELLKNPVADSAKELYPLFKRAYAWTPRHGTLDEDVRAALAVAAWAANTPADQELARNLSRELFDLWRAEDGDLRKDRAEVLPLYFVHWLANQTQPEGVDAAARMMFLLKSGVRNADDSKALYDRVLGPTLAWARDHGKHAFLAELGDFVKKYGRREWEFRSAMGEPLMPIEKALELYGEAIRGSNEQEPTYFEKRALGWLEKAAQDADEEPIDSALADTSVLVKLNYNPRAVALLRSLAYYWKGHFAVGASKKQAELANALQELEPYLPKGANAGAVQLDSSILHRASKIYLLWGNYAYKSDAERERVFSDAARYADLARDASTGSEREECLRTAGNAYEDLAWLSRIKPDVNYKTAIDRFRAATAGDSAAAYRDLGRCYYKIIASSNLDPKFLGKNHHEVWDSARLALDKAIKIANEKKEAADEADAHHWMGRLLQVAGLSERVTPQQARDGLSEEEFLEAQKHLVKSLHVSIAARASAEYTIDYARHLVEHAKLHPGLRKNAPAGLRTAATNNTVIVVKMVRELNQRYVTRYFVPGLEATMLQKRVEWMTGRRPKAVLDSLSQAEKIMNGLKPKDATKSDVELLKLRRELRWKVENDERVGKLVEDGVKEAIWLADVPDDLFSSTDKVALLKEAIEQLCEHGLKIDDDAARYRKLQLEAFDTLTTAFPTHSQVSQWYKATAGIWVLLSQDKKLSASEKSGLLKAVKQRIANGKARLEKVGNRKQDVETLDQVLKSAPLNPA